MNFNFKFSFCRLFFGGFCKLKIYKLLRSLLTFRNENFVARTKLAILWNLTLQNIYPIDRNMSLFENRKKVLNQPTVYCGVGVVGYGGVRGD